MSGGESIATAYDLAALSAASGVLVPARGVEITLRGFGIKCTGGNAAFEIREGTAGGKLLVPFLMLDGQAVEEPAMHLTCDGDLYVHFTSGAANVFGSIWVA